MYLTDHEKSMLDGAHGRVKQVSMQYVVDYARALDAERLCTITKAQVFCGSHLHLKAIAETDVDKAIALMHFASDEPLKFNRDTACYTQTCVLRTELDPAKAAELGFDPAEIAENQAHLARYKDAGVHMVGTCSPYLSGFLPIRGEHYVCTESHAIIFMNSVWGAAANADGIAAAFCSAMCGRTAYWGNHVPSQRRANLLVRVECATADLHDWDSLGFVLGRRAPAYAIPALAVRHPGHVNAEVLRSSYASMATSGGVELCHVLGVTPEAPDQATAFGGLAPENEFAITDQDLRECREFLCDQAGGPVDYIHFGCPHYSLEQIATVARFLEGKKVSPFTALHIWTAPSVKFLADLNGYTRTIEKAGAKLYAGSCALVAGKLPQGVGTIAFDSAKQANPKKSAFNGRVLYGSQLQCLRAAVAGRWEA